MTRTESVLQRLNIAYKPNKNGFVAKCPNPAHNDRNPSWSIRSDGLHSCWSCGFKGDIYTLVRTVLECTFVEAKAFAGDPEQAAIEPVLPIEVRVSYRSGIDIPDGVEFPEGEWPYSVQSYLDQRGITREQVAKWGIGYAKSGELSGRIFIPYCDRFGDLQSYTARSFTGQTPKYKKPGPTEGAVKAALFGEQHWPVLKKWVIVTEGELNALAAERAMPVAVAALSGSRMSPAHAVKLIQFENIICLTDSDPAGDKAALQLLAAVGRHANIARLRLPDNVDANDMPRNELRERLTAVMSRL